MAEIAGTTATLALLAGVAFVIGNALAIARGLPNVIGAWRIPAMLSVAFLLFSAVTIGREGLTGFWPEHSARGLWGNQIWFDLLLAATACLWLALPRLRAQSMSPWLWLIAIVATGSVGLMAMLAQIWRLESDRGSNAR